MNIEPIYTPKSPCPRDLGTLFCDECKERNLQESSEVDYPVKLTEGCGKIIDNNQKCGFTHLGFYWCDDCVKNNRESGHYGQFEVVAYITSD